MFQVMWLQCPPYVLHRENSKFAKKKKKKKKKVILMFPSSVKMTYETKDTATRHMDWSVATLSRKQWPTQAREQ